MIQRSKMLIALAVGVGITVGASLLQAQSCRGNCDLAFQQCQTGCVDAQSFDNCMSGCRSAYQSCLSGCGSNY